MAIEIAAPIKITSEVPEIREKRTSSTIRQYAKVICEESIWDDINAGLHKQTFNQLFAALDKKGMIRNGMVALFIGSHEGHDVSFFKKFVDEGGYRSVTVIALEMTDRHGNVPGVSYIRADALYPPLVPESVDLIIDRLAATYTSFRYYPESGLQVFAEAHRILNPGGSLILDGGDLKKVQRINTWGSSATQIENFCPELFQQMKDGFVHLAGMDDNNNYQFQVRQFNVLGIPNEWGKIELGEGNGGWLHYQFTKILS